MNSFQKLSVMEKIFDSPVFSIIVYELFNPSIIAGSVGHPIKVLDTKTLAIKQEIPFPARRVYIPFWRSIATKWIINEEIISVREHVVLCVTLGSAPKRTRSSSSGVSMIMEKNSIDLISRFLGWFYQNLSSAERWKFCGEECHREPTSKHLKNISV